ncbi:MAG: hypothetical protein LBC75_04805 [Fibromonadaceae bacterium]|nr:hypothetical protein [Fibromonadaceae bacterium]
MLKEIIAIIVLTSPIWGIWVAWKLLFAWFDFVDYSCRQHESKRERKKLIKNGVDPKDLEIIDGDLYQTIRK